MTVTDSAHVAAAKVLREQFHRPDPSPFPMPGWSETWPTTTAPSA